MTVRIPAEWEPHACCWMAWAVHAEWGKSVNKVKRELSEIVQTIARYEPVRVLAPRGNTLKEAQREFSDCSNVTVIEAPNHCTASNPGSPASAKVGTSGATATRVALVTP